MSSEMNVVTPAPAPAGEVDHAPAQQDGADGAERLQNVTDRDVSGGEGDGLSVAQLRALDMIIFGETDTSIAKTLGVSRMTLWRWQTNHAPFKAELARRRRVLWNTTADRYRHLLARSADVFEWMMNQRYDMHRYRAAYAVLQMAGRFAPAPEPEPQPDAMKACSPEARVSRERAQRSTRSPVSDAGGDDGSGGQENERAGDQRPHGVDAGATAAEREHRTRPRSQRGRDGNPHCEKAGSADGE